MALHHACARQRLTLRQELAVRFLAAHNFDNFRFIFCLRAFQ